MNYYVYILSNKYNTVLYIGVTNNLKRRIYQHKKHLFPGFTSIYNVNKLIYFEQTPNIRAAIEREKQLKRWSRSKKNNLIKAFNLRWDDLSTILSIT